MCSYFLNFLEGYWIIDLVMWVNRKNVYKFVDSYFFDFVDNIVIVSVFVNDF